MRKAPHLDAAAVATWPRRWCGGDAARLALFLTTEQAASLCRDHVQGPSGWRLGAATPVAAALATMLWTFGAHARLAFRFQGSARPPGGLAPFVLLSWACLDLQALASVVAPSVALAASLLIGGAKFLLVQRWVWPPAAQPSL